MSPKRRRLTVLGLGLLGTALVAVAPVASRTAPTPRKPVIGVPRPAPARPVAGKRFTVSFLVTDRNSGAPVVRGTMTCDLSVAGSTIPHTESFKGGTARLSLVIPGTAGGMLLKVRVAIRSAGRSATRAAAFHVAAPPPPPPSVSIGDAAVAEGNAGTTTMTRPSRCRRGRAGTSRSRTRPRTEPPKAPSDDRAAASGTLAFQAGETTKSILISVVGDTAVEPNETFTVTLSNVVDASIATSIATGRITNDDSGMPVTPGSYKGATQNGNYVFFTVLADRTLRRFRVNDLPQRCGGVRTTGGEDLGDSVYRINANGAFSGKTTWTGSVVENDVEWTRRDTRLTGTFNSPTSATGTITVNTEMNLGGRALQVLLRDHLLVGETRGVMRPGVLTAAV